MIWIKELNLKQQKICPGLNTPTWNLKHSHVSFLVNSLLVIINPRLSVYELFMWAQILSELNTLFDIKTVQFIKRKRESFQIS